MSDTATNTTNAPDASDVALDPETSADTNADIKPEVSAEVEQVLTADQVCSTGVVTHSHDTGENSHVLCLAVCDCGKPTTLPVLFNDGALVTLTINVPEDGAPGSEPSEHPPIFVHLNPGDDLHHEPCLTFQSCGPCMGPVWESFFAAGGGRIGVHAFPEDPDTVLVAPFRIENWKQTREALKTAQSRLVAQP